MKNDFTKWQSILFFIYNWCVFIAVINKLIINYVLSREKLQKKKYVFGKEIGHSYTNKKVGKSKYVFFFVCIFAIS